MRPSCVCVYELNVARCDANASSTQSIAIVLYYINIHCCYRYWWSSFVRLEVLKDIFSDGKEVPLLLSRTTKFCQTSFNVGKGGMRAMVFCDLLIVTFFILNFFENVHCEGEVVELSLARPEIGHVVVVVVVVVCGGGDGLIWKSGSGGTSGIVCS